MTKFELVDCTPEITVLFQDVAFRFLNRLHFWAKALHALKLPFYALSECPKTMKSIVFLSGILISLLAGSCQKSEKSGEQTSSQMVADQLKADVLIRDTVTNQDGVQLAMTFNQSKQTATLVLKGETIDLKQDQMASGIKYSNPDYEFTEHQGEGMLKKGGTIIFSYKK